VTLIPHEVGPGEASQLQLSTVLLETYWRLLGKQLAPAGLDEGDAARWLYEKAPFCVLAHNTDSDPVFIYANKTAQRCFEYTWAEFITLPSRLSAEAPNRAKRQVLLDEVGRRGFAINYTGMRISRSGRRFFIEDATVWQLVDRRGVHHGQGAMLPRWHDVAPSQSGAQ